MEIKTIGSTRAFEGRVFEVFVDQVEYPSGTRASREVVHHPGGSAVVPLLENGRILLVEQFRYPFRKRLLELPAGRLEPGEDPAETALRELREETGMIAAGCEPLARIYPTPGFCDEIIHIFLARDMTQAQSTPTREEGELHLTVRDISLAEAVQQIDTGEIRDSKTIIGVLLTLRKLGK